jgi:uncharacterized protein
MITVVCRAPSVLLVVTVVLGACTRAPERVPVYPAQVRFGAENGGVVLHVAIARSDVDRERGLMYVRSLPNDAGMAFVWTEPTETGFWMKNTLIPLSVAFVDDEDRVVTIRDMAPCTSEPCPLYGADAPFVMAVEANRGWFADHGVAEGDAAVLEPSS